MLFLSGALAQWDGPYFYEREIWFEDRSGKIDPEKDLEGVDVLLISALINEVPRAYEIGRMAKEFHPDLITVGGGPHMGPFPTRPSAKASSTLSSSAKARTSSASFWTYC